MKYPPVLCVVAGAALLSGCHDDESRRPWDTTLNDDVNVASIGSEDKRNVCSSLEANLSARLDMTQLTRLVCLPSAILRASGNRALCQELLAQCIHQSTPSPLLVGARIDPERCVASLARCDAHVGALESCVNVNVSGVLDLLDDLTCSRLDDAAMRERARHALDVRGTLTTCADLSSGCRHFVSDVVVH